MIRLTLERTYPSLRDFIAASGERAVEAVWGSDCFNPSAAVRVRVTYEVLPISEKKTATPQTQPREIT